MRTLTAVNGVAEVVEAGTGTNFVRDTVFQGNDQAYTTYKNVMQTTAEIGTAICGTYYAAKGGNVCFVAGTLIATAVGHIAIEAIEAGDWVWATNPETGETTLKPVVQTFVNQADELVHVTVNGETITCTNEHPFYSPVKGWIVACQLRAGDVLVMLNGERIVVEQVQHELLESSVTVYNFEVADYHTYHVSEHSVLVHNECTRSNSKKYSAEKIADKYNITVEQYHKQVKREILRQAPPQTHLVGKNPNIMLNKVGEIGYQGANGVGFQNTYLTMGEILKKLGLR